MIRVHFYSFLFFLFDPSRSELIRPGQAVRVDPVQLFVPACEEGHSTILLVHYFFLVLIEDKVVQRRWLRLKIAQKCLLLLYNLHILASDQKKVLFYEQPMSNFSNK